MVREGFVLKLRGFEMWISAERILDFKETVSLAIRLTQRQAVGPN